MALDCCNQTSVDCVMPEIVDARDLPGNIADSPNNGSGVLHSCALARNGDLA
jgi:hypothetical protein